MQYAQGREGFNYPRAGCTLLYVDVDISSSVRLRHTDGV